MSEREFFKFMVNYYFLLPDLRAETKNGTIVRLSKSIYNVEKNMNSQPA